MGMMLLGERLGDCNSWEGGVELGQNYEWYMRGEVKEVVMG